MTNLLPRWRTFQWERGARAAVAVGSAMAVCHGLGLPPGAAALGAFDALLVDNGGPYRSRLVTMGTTLLGGSAAFLLGCLLPAEMALTVLVTFVVCFLVIFSRVLSQPLASSGVLILVLYFAGLGGTVHTFASAWGALGLVLAGGVWAMALSLGLWPVDPFRPARQAVAECFRGLGGFASGLATGGDAAVFEWKRGERARLELARGALAATAARAPSRTIRARNLTVLLETADLLLERTARLTEFADVARGVGDAEAQSRLAALADWLSGAAKVIAEGLAERPADAGAAFEAEGSLRLQWLVRRRATMRETQSSVTGSLLGYVHAEELEALLEVQTAFEAVVAIWTGTEVRPGSRGGNLEVETGHWDLFWIDSGWRDALGSNWTIHSAMFRHALRMAIVGTIDVVVMRVLHLNHGFWLPMTSLILLQPYSAGTARKSLQRVSGTVAGGVFAALLAASIADPVWSIVLITVLTGMTLATFAVDYAVYSFFLTPAFVLLSLPHPHDWQYAGIRVGLTLLGSAISLGAMRLLWPERAEEELGRLLRRGAAADAAYLRALARVVGSGAGGQASEALALARRACGLASNDAEEAVDRVMQEPQFGRVGDAELRLRDGALTFATYLRRLTQSVTTLAAMGRASAGWKERLDTAALQMDGVALGDLSEPDHGSGPGSGADDLAEEQMRRVERQVGVLQKTAGVLRAAGKS